SSDLRLLPISAAIYAKNKEDLELKRAYLTSLFNPKLGEMEFIYTNNALTKRVKGVVQDITFQTPVGLMQKFL
ncbi:phage tail domain-containing protein, partial [Clostridioides difficile]|uniref:phage tail domain-containing protein n=1 Tax=Clostridioides difficile TaxID=1496 RepID=UPI001CA533BE